MTIVYKRQIPVRHDVDVMVAGGGPAGIGAALAAARQGASVFLIDSQSCFGGMATAALVPSYFTLYSDGINLQAGGIASEIYQRLDARNGFGPGVDYRNPKDRWLPLRTEVLKCVFDEIVSEQKTLKFTFQTRLIDVETDGRRLTHAICAAKSGVFTVRARQFIDCTGDGDLAAWAGAAFEKGNGDGLLQPGTLCTAWTDIDWFKVQSSGLSAEAEIQRAITDGVFSVADPHLPGIHQTGRHTGTGNIGHTFGVDNTDEVSLTKALIHGRRITQEYQRFYREYLKGYEHMELVTTGALLGVRETRRVLGDYVLNLDDYQKRAVFVDEIGRYSYPIDVHPAQPTAENLAQFEYEYEQMRYQPGESYGIPLRSLIVRDLDNVLVAGRCVSCDRYIQGSIRVGTGCYITGQAAGVAAALAAQTRHELRAIDARQVQSRLVELGAYLPNV